MKVDGVRQLKNPDIKLISVSRFKDHRGYFTETYRASDFSENEQLSFLKGMAFLQCNESYSKARVCRGLHFQWNPFMGKLVRTVSGRMIDLVLDIRKNSPYYGKILAVDMPSKASRDTFEWVWVPPGFAHGNFFTEETVIEYFCTGSYSPNSEAGISPFADDIDWSLCESKLKNLFDQLKDGEALISDKDKHGFSIAEWEKQPASANFIYSSI